MDRIGNNDILMSEETFAAWLDGTMSPAEEENFMQAVASDPELAEILDANDEVEDSYESMVEIGFEQPDWFDEEFDIPVIAEFDDGLLLTSHDEYDPDSDSYENGEETGEDENQEEVSFDSSDGDFPEDESESDHLGFEEFTF